MFVLQTFYQINHFILNIIFVCGCNDILHHETCVAAKLVIILQPFSCIIPGFLHVRLRNPSSTIILFFTLSFFLPSFPPPPTPPPSPLLLLTPSTLLELTPRSLIKGRVKCIQLQNCSEEGSSKFRGGIAVLRSIL